MRSSPSTPLWRCPRCGERFTTRHQWHSCGTFALDPLFVRSEPHVRQLFDRLLAMVCEQGPVTVIPQKSRIALQVRMRFMALIPQKTALKGHFVFARRHRSPRFEHVESYSLRTHVHVFRLSRENELDHELRRWIGEAYAVGCQRHLSRGRSLPTVREQ